MMWGGFVTCGGFSIRPGGHCADVELPDNSAAGLSAARRTASPPQAASPPYSRRSCGKGVSDWNSESVLHADRRIENPPQVTNLPHKAYSEAAA